MKVRLPAILFIGHFFLFSLSASIVQESPIGCPSQMLEFVGRMKSHGNLNTPMDWSRFLTEQPNGLVKWLEVFEWFEEASSNAKEELRLGLSRGQTLEEILQAVQVHCSETISESVAHAFRLLRRDFSPDWPKENPSLKQFLLKLPREAITSLIRFGYSEEFLGAKEIREYFSIPLALRHPKVEKHLHKFLAEVPQAGLSFMAFFQIINSTFSQELKDGILTGLRFEVDWNSFSSRHKIYNIAYPKSAETLYEFIRLGFLAHYPFSEQGIAWDKVSSSVQSRLERDLSQIYIEESRRQAKHPLPKVSPVIEPVAKPLVLDKPVEYKVRQEMMAPAISHRRHKQQAALSAMAGESKTQEGMAVAPPPVFDKPEDLPIQRFIHASDRNDFLHWLHNEAADVQSQILRRIELMETHNVLTLAATKGTAPTSRDPRIWRIKTNSKARVAVHFQNTGKYWILSWDAQAKTSNQRTDRMIDEAIGKLAAIAH